MPQQRKTRTSYATKVFRAALLTAVCVLPGFTCEFEPSSIGKHPPAEKRFRKVAPAPNDEDSGDKR